jgi:hypothetical protein
MSADFTSSEIAAPDLSEEPEIDFQPGEVDEFFLPEGDSDDDEQMLMQLPEGGDAEVEAIDSSRMTGSQSGASSSRKARSMRLAQLHLPSQAKRGLGDTRANSLHYYAGKIGVNPLWPRTQGPQAVVFCDRSHDRKRQEKDRQAARMAELPNKLRKLCSEPRCTPSVAKPCAQP